MTEPYAPDANDVLMGGGGAATAKFTTPWTTIGGPIVAKPRTFHEREYNKVTRRSDGPPKYFPSGDPIMGITVDVRTNLRDPSIDDDDGVRRIYVQGKRMKEAIRQAVLTSGGPGLEVGGELHVTYTGDGEADGGVNAPKLYQARYVPAATAVLNGAVAEPQPPASTSQPAPVQTPATPPAGIVSGYTAEQLAAAGLTPEAAAALLNVNPAALHSMVAQAIAKAS